MGETDIVTKSYLKDNRRFADLCNGVLFKGQQIISPKELRSLDSSNEYVNEEKSKLVTTDITKQWHGIKIVVLSLENQTYVDYRMVLRSFLSEALYYHEQWYRKKREHQRRKDLQGDEYLSGIKRNELFISVITIVIYYGLEKAWDGACSLYDLLDMKEMEETIKPFISNYRLNLFDFHHYDRFDMFQTELRLLFEFLSCAQDKERLKKCITENAQEYKTMDTETVQLLSKLTGTKNLEKLIVKAKRTKGEVDMCKAFDDMKEDGRMEGRAEIIKTILKNGIAIEKVAEMTNLPINEIQKMSKQRFS